jgi:radical SAM/Cys-rich protein
MTSFEKKIQDLKLDMSVASVSTLQVNITKLCNQACRHCHVDSSPQRREMMSRELIETCLHILKNNAEITSLDITGGAPELHSDFKYFVIEARKLNKQVMVRHNLTVTHDPHPISGESMLYLPEFFKEQSVELVSSLPYYDKYFTDRQRGSGVFHKSITSLKMLNDIGFGLEGSSLKLNLVYNPIGPFLPASQTSLEEKFKSELKAKFNVSFNHLFTITNMPIKRFAKELERLNQYEEYMEKLRGAFNPNAALGVMCRSLISVDHQGQIFDCDFNQMLNLPIDSSCPSQNIIDFDLTSLKKRSIVLKDHCFGCTAGAGSSCGGATA